MKFVVVSDKTIETALIKETILDQMKSDKEKELEKKQKDELDKKEKNKNKDNNDVIVKPPENKEKPPETKEKPPETKEKPPETKEKPPETKEKPPETKEKPPETKEKPPETKEKPPETKTPETKTPPIVTDTDLTKTTEPPKPTNPSGKVIPKPKKPLMKNSPAAKAGIPVETRQKISNMNAAFQATKDKNSGYTKMDFIKDFPNSQTAKKYAKGERIPGFRYPKKTKKVKAEPPVNIKDMSAISKPKEVTIDDFKSTPAPKKEEIKSSYEPYHIVLGYLLHEGHADTINEAHYVMTQMDEQTIKEIVALDEGLGGKIASVAALTLGGMGLDAIRKQLQNKKKMDQGGKFKPGSMMDNIQKRNEMLKNM